LTNQTVLFNIYILKHENEKHLLPKIKERKGKERTT